VHLFITDTFDGPESVPYTGLNLILLHYTLCIIFYRHNIIPDGPFGFCAQKKCGGGGGGTTPKSSPVNMPLAIPGILDSDGFQSCVNTVLVTSGTHLHYTGSKRLSVTTIILYLINSENNIITPCRLQWRLLTQCLTIAGWSVPSIHGSKLLFTTLEQERMIYT